MGSLWRCSLDSLSRSFLTSVISVPATHQVRSRCWPRIWEVSGKSGQRLGIWYEKFDEVVSMLRMARVNCRRKFVGSGEVRGRGQ
jgi:hypothetical protein